MKPKIGMPIIGNAEWLGGVSYVENLIKAVRILPVDEQPYIYLFVNDNTIVTLELYAHFLHLFNGIIYTGVNSLALSEALSKPVTTVSSFDELFEIIDFYFAGPSDIPSSYCYATWIPDFQYLHLPQYFHPDERASRDKENRYKAEHARMIVLSSHDVQRDFHSRFPDSKAVTRILSFHTLPEEEWLCADPEPVRQKFNIPETFLICCNQFWAHKNHKLLFEALVLLRKQGVIVPLVCTGSTSDHRFPEYFKELLAYMEQIGIADQVHILGNIPRCDQIQLIRRSLAVVQPSLFEGWSTVVEDARALGKTLILSDLEVHKEQAPDFTVYYDRNDANDLAATIYKMLPLLKPGPDLLREQLALRTAQEQVRQYGRSFCKIAIKAIEEASRAKSISHSVAREIKPQKKATFPCNSASNKVKISIVTPSFNQAEYLEECMDSILSQNYPNLEYIIMDGGSTDGSVEIIKKYSKHLAYWQSKADGGQYPAINEGFSHSTGTIMAWLNSDDKYHSGALWLVSDIFESSPLIEWIMGIPTLWDTSGALNSATYPPPSWSRKLYLQGKAGPPHIQQESTFWRRDLWERAGGKLDTTFAYAADMELWSRFFRYTHLHTVDAMLGGFRSQPNQKTAQHMDSYNKEAVAIIMREQMLFKSSNNKALLEAPPVVTLNDVVNRAHSGITPDNFGYFTYSRTTHFPFFAGFDLELYGVTPNPQFCDLKVYQDLLVLTFIRQNIPSGSRLLEIGGGDSRLLNALQFDYECWNLDKLEGLGNGPVEIRSSGYKMIRDYIGKFNHELKENYFDFVFSISVFEHIEEREENFRDIIADIDRVLKPNGLSLHCFDVVAKNDTISVWTNTFLNHIFKYVSTANKFIPLQQIYFDPYTYVMSQNSYEAIWQPITKVSYQQFGFPLSYNVLWRKER